MCSAGAKLEFTVWVSSGVLFAGGTHYGKDRSVMYPCVCSWIGSATLALALNIKKMPQDKAEKRWNKTKIGDAKISLRLETETHLFIL